MIKRCASAPRQLERGVFRDKRSAAADDDDVVKEAAARAHDDDGAR